MTWKEFYKDILANENVSKLRKDVKDVRLSRNVLPGPQMVMNAFKQCAYEDLRIVVLGEEPYPKAGHSDGLAFSSTNIKTPKSLKNIFLEIQRQLFPNSDPLDLFATNDLTAWANQGILLLNKALTVEEGKPKSHSDIGWNHLIEPLFIKLNTDYPRRLCFVLLGEGPKKLEKYITQERHLVLTADNPYTGGKGYFGNDHFKKIDEFCREHYFESYPKAVPDSVYKDLADATKKWYEENGVSDLTDEDMKQLADFYIKGLPIYISELSPEIKTLYEINWRLK